MLGQIGPDAVAQDLPLVGEDLLHQRHLLGGARGVLRDHRPVARPSHPLRVAVLEFSVRLHARVPEVVNALLADRVVVRPAVRRGPGPPFLGRVAQQHLDVRRAHDDAVKVRVLRVFGVLVEVVRAAMHRGPKEVRLESQQELEDPLVGLGADLLAGVDLGGGPGREVLLVVDEDAAVLDGRLTLFRDGAVDDDGGGHRRRDIRPPVPGGHAHSL